MARRMEFDETYYAEQSHDEAPWLIRNREDRVVAHYTVNGGINWGALMTDADKERLLLLIKQKLT